MRTFNFKARNIGQEKYLTYTMGEECELDEDVLDYCEENQLKELVDIIYEEDDDYDYLTYDITGKKSLEDLLAVEMKSANVLFLLRNIASSMISLKEQAIHLSYILLNRNYMYVAGEDMNVEFICLPVESKAAVSAEFKSFIRQLLANMKYDVEEDLNYVGKLLTYINSDGFNLRGLIGLCEALMEEAGLSFEEAGTIETDGVEIVNTEPDAEAVEIQAEEKVSEFMSALSEQDETLPEIGDDEEDIEEDAGQTVVDDELDSILPAGMKVPEEQTVEATTIETPVQAEAEVAETKVQPVLKNEIPVAEAEAKVPEIELPGAKEVEAPMPADKPTLQTKEADIDVIKNRIKELVGEVPPAKTKFETGKSINTLEELDQLLDSKPPVIKKNVVKVNRAALIQNAAEHEGETEKLSTPATGVPAIEDIKEDMNQEKADKPKSNSILSKTVSEPARHSLLNAPKAMPYLIRVNTEERIMLGKVTFKIGKASRGVDYTVSGNGAISRQHAVIIQKDGVCYIKDNKSTNHTYVNGKMVEEGVEEILTHDSMIKLGDEEFLFKIR